MEGFLKQSTAVTITVLLVDSSDHVTGKTGLAAGLTITATKAGTYSSSAITPTVTELDATNAKGLYSLALTTTHTNTLGELSLHIVASGADPADYKWQVSTYLPGEAATLQADQAVNTTKVGGTTQTARDLGLSVLISSGTGTGQLDVTSGVIKANLAQILGTALTETAGLLAGGFKKFFNVATPTGTLNSIPDAVPDAAGGLPVTGNRLTAIPTVAAVTTVTNLTNAPTAGDLTATMKTSVTTAATAATPTVTAGTVSDKTGYALTSAYDPAKTAAQAGDAMALTTGERTTLAAAIWNALTSGLTTVGSAGKLLVDNLDAKISTRSSHSAADVWAVTTRLLTAGTNIVLAKGTGVTGLNDLDAAGVRSAVGLATANLDTQIDALPTAAENADAVWDETLGDHLTSGSTGAGLNAASSAGDPWATAIPGSYGSGTAGKIVGDNIDAKVSTRLATSGYTAPDNTSITAIKAKTDQLAFTLTNKVDASIQAAGDFAQAAADKVWSTTSRTLSAFGFSVTVGTNNDKTGYSLTSAYDPAKTASQAGDAMALTSGERTSLAGVIWATLTSGLTTVGSVGKRIADNLDAAVSSRSTYAGGDTAGVTTLLTRVPGTVQPQTGDAYARLGAPAGASVSADVAAVKSDSGAIKAQTDEITFTTPNRVDATAITVSDKTGYRLSATGVDDVLRTALTEDYAAAGAAPTIEQALFAVQQMLAERSIVGTTLTINKLDGTTEAMSFTLNDAAVPTAQTRAS